MLSSLIETARLEKDMTQDEVANLMTMPLEHYQFLEKAGSFPRHIHHILLSRDILKIQEILGLDFPEVDSSEPDQDAHEALKLMDDDGFYGFVHLKFNSVSSERFLMLTKFEYENLRDQLNDEDNVFVFFDSMDGRRHYINTNLIESVSFQSRNSTNELDSSLLEDCMESTLVRSNAFWQVFYLYPIKENPGIVDFINDFELMDKEKEDILFLLGGDKSFFQGAHGYFDFVEERDPKENARSHTREFFKYLQDMLEMHLYFSRNIVWKCSCEDDQTLIMDSQTMDNDALPEELDRAFISDEGKFFAHAFQSDDHVLYLAKKSLEFISVPQHLVV